MFWTGLKPNSGSTRVQMGPEAKQVYDMESHVEKI